ncbi:hypothetical protein FRC02_002633 [Tulasnella sp. 418]|nr:hypothetical protein FRC02_002633 [Tulasnella sp. 418]
MSTHSTASIKKDQESNKETDYVEHAPQPVDRTFERQTIRKIDLRLIPILSLLYAFSLIDRTNLGLIRVAGMDRALGLSIGNRYSIITLLFFVPYIIFELPANIYIRKVGVSLFLGTIAVLWGAITLASGFVKNWQSLAGLRVLLGFLEAGYFPACAYLISLWYTRREIQTRMAFFYMFSLLAAGFSPILSYGISQMHGRSGVAGWSWIFIIEGLVTCVLGFLAYFCKLTLFALTHIACSTFYLNHYSPDKNKFLSAEQTEWLLQRINKDRGDAEYDPLTMKKFWAYVQDLKLWAFALCFMASTLASYAISFFLPVILAGMRYNTRDSQLLCSPPYVFTVIYALIFSIISDRVNKRAPFLLLNCILSIIGGVLIAYTKGNGSRYFGVFIMLAGCSANVPGVLAYQANNIVGQSKRAYASALTISFGGIGGIFASLVYRQKDAPNYRPGIIATIACQCFMILLLGACSLHFFLRNREVKKGSTKWIEGKEGFLFTL